MLLRLRATVIQHNRCLYHNLGGSPLKPRHCILLTAGKLQDQLPSPDCSDHHHVALSCPQRCCPLPKESATMSMLFMGCHPHHVCVLVVLWWHHPSRHLSRYFSPRWRSVHAPAQMTWSVQRLGCWRRPSLVEQSRWGNGELCPLFCSPIKSIVAHLLSGGEGTWLFVGCRREYRAPKTLTRSWVQAENNGALR